MLVTLFWISDIALVAWFRLDRNLPAILPVAVLTGSVYAKLLYNDKNQNLNKTLPFVATDYPLAISKLVVITTRSTSGTSEAVINGLSPNINVVSVGDTTQGVPEIMNVWPCLKKYYFCLVTAKTVNSLDQDFYDGFPPDKRDS